MGGVPRQGCVTLFYNLRRIRIMAGEEIVWSKAYVNFPRLRRPHVHAPIADSVTQLFLDAHHGVVPEATVEIQSFPDQQPPRTQ
jgi:hypothetical protein